MESQFWGVVLQPEKMYEQTVESSFHVSMAAIETSTLGGNKATSVFVEAGGDEYLICNLNSSNLNVHLDLNFIEGEKIGFRSTGPGTIHLTGYLIPESDDMLEDYEDSESEEEEEAPALVNGKNGKRKALLSDDSPSMPSKKTKKELALARANKVLEEYAAKKKKQGQEEDDDDTSDDGILDFTENYAEEEDSEEEEDDDSSDEVVEEESEEDKDESMEASPPPKKTPEKGSQKKQKQQTTPKNNNSNGVSKKEDTPGSASKKELPKSLKTVFKGGVQCEELRVGSGPEVKKGKVIGMYYDGRLKNNNKRFDANLSGKPFKFRLGAGEVIKGWDLGLEGMKVGGKRRLTIPPKLAYGAQGAPPDIPPNSSLVFEVECKFVK